jgi:hypothetical protein
MGRKIARIMRSRNSTMNVIKLCEQRKGWSRSGSVVGGGGRLVFVTNKEAAVQIRVILVV